jgi:hypothetical protein
LYAGYDLGSKGFTGRNSQSYNRRIETLHAWQSLPLHRLQKNYRVDYGSGEENALKILDVPKVPAVQIVPTPYLFTPRVAGDD